MGSLDNMHHVERLVAKARREKKWLYDPDCKRWWNPDEFYAEFAIASYSLLGFYTRVKLRDPFDGVKAADEEVNKIQKQVQLFSERVLRYYKNKSVDPPPKQ